MRRKRNVEAFSLSFLDCICCGFGAIILLLVLSKIYEPVVVEEAESNLEQLIALLQEELFQLRGQTTELDRTLKVVQEDAAATQLELSIAQGDLSKVRGQYEASRQNEEEAIDEGELRSARQRLTEEMKRLLPFYQRSDADAVAGIPVDSEYIIFVIDTSNSMINYNWGLVQRKVREALEAYPTVKGIQIMNDDGMYMFPDYAGRWIPDSPGRRQAIISRMRTWFAQSDSNPVDGIQAAIETYWAPDKKISIYVFGDDFAGDMNIDQVVGTIDRRNRVQADGTRRVRIHGVGFPRGFRGGGNIPRSAIRFATLMRVLCDRNGGTFVALTDANR
ncbi:MAG: VWA domain-containing protein [Gammaproteobacteria bacterium]|nr:VWA domain-containing protein [Gammaproteobacteria bacterium]MBT8094448.1 VWA domain-containing protein [Gammaproteobacteria bacterium]MBT8105296.1 VWA domain-containing protein [Gammaproteobacteria bacterium]NNK25310.1 VWA domain-containing protein [Woeseiaceae bacterium]